MVYLLNEGYKGRVDLASEAIRLGRVLLALMPDESEVRGLLALMLAHDARRAARFDGDDLVLLQDQDRARWDAGQLEEARAAAGARHRRARPVRPAGCDRRPPHRGPRGLDGDRRPVRRARERTGSPVVELNRAAALAQTGATELALSVAEGLATDLDGYPYLHSTRAELLRRLGRYDEARAAYGRALAISADERERRFLRDRTSELERP